MVNKDSCFACFAQVLSMRMNKKKGRRRSRKRSSGRRSLSRERRPSLLFEVITILIEQVWEGTPLHINLLITILISKALNTFSLFWHYCQCHYLWQDSMATYVYVELHLSAVPNKITSSVRWESTSVKVKVLFLPEPRLPKTGKHNFVIILSGDGDEMRRGDGNVFSRSGEGGTDAD